MGKGSLLILVAVMVWITGSVWLMGYTGRVHLRDSQIAGCERGKLDRKDNAASWTAHRKYIEKVVLAQSVKEDVKRAAREANRTHELTAKHLTKRSLIDCQKVIPKPPLLF